jgi:hypothetical protein
MDAVAAIGVLEALHAAHLVALLGAEAPRLGVGGPPRRPGPPGNHGVGVREVAATVLLRMLGFAVFLLEDDGASALHAIEMSDYGLALLVAVFAAQQAHSLEEAVLVCACLPATAAIVSAAVLFLSGEDDGTATALVAGLGLALAASLFPHAAARDERLLMYGALAASVVLVWAAVWLLGGQPDTHDVSFIDGTTVLCLVFLGTAPAVIYMVAAPEDHALSQFSMASAAVMVGASIFLMSGEEARGGGDFAGWALMAAASLVSVSAKSGELRPVLSSLAAFVATVAWSLRIITEGGEVITFVDESLLFVVCWILPGVALVVNIAHCSSDRQEAWLVSGALLTTAAMLWCALYFVDPSQFPALASAHCAQTPPPPHTCAKAAATNVKSHVGWTKDADTNVELHTARGVERVGELVVEQSLELEIEIVLEPIVAVVDNDTSAVVAGGEHVPTTSEESIAASDDAEGQHDGQNDHVPITNAEVTKADVSPSVVADRRKPDSLSAAAREQAQPDRNYTMSSQQEESQAFNVLACPGCWALMYSLPLISKAVEFKGGTGGAGAAAFGLATGTAFFLAISMFECSFRYLASEDAGPSVCTRPDLLMHAMVVMVACVMTVPAVASPDPEYRTRQKASFVWEAGSALVLAVVVGLCVTANMTGCALHHVAPQEMGSLACGPFVLFSRTTDVVADFRAGLQEPEESAADVAAAQAQAQENQEQKAADAAKAATIAAEMQQRETEAAMAEAASAEAARAEQRAQEIAAEAVSAAGEAAEMQQRETEAARAELASAEAARAEAAAAEAARAEAARAEAARAEAAAAEGETRAQEIAAEAVSAAREAAAAAKEARALAAERDSSAADVDTMNTGEAHSALANEADDAEKKQLAAARKLVETEIRRKAAELRGEKYEDATIPAESDTTIEVQTKQEGLSFYCAIGCVCALPLIA